MVERSIPTNIQQSLDCAICFEEYSNDRMPCTLPCGHSLCTSCVFQLLKNSSITCPMDKKTMNLAAISGNNSLMNLINIAKCYFLNKD